MFKNRFGFSNTNYVRDALEFHYILVNNIDPQVPFSVLNFGAGLH